MTRAGEKIPIVVLTGFLGSGKTTLLGTMLRRPDFSDTAVVVNEIGTVGLDHHLVQGASESVLVLENGCVCCSARDDLAGVLSDLFWDRLYRKIPRFSRVAIETTGIATPGPIAETITGDPLLAERFLLSRVVTTVDGVQAPRQIAEHREAVEQVMGADLLLITKPDLADPGALEALERHLHTLNSQAEIVRASMGALDPERFFPDTETVAAIVSRPSGEAEDGHRGRHDHDHSHDRGERAHDNPVHAHAERIHQFTARIDRAPSLADLIDGITALVRDPRAGLLRVKGIVRPEGEPIAMVFQAAGDLLHPPVPMDSPEWASGPGFLTLIGTEADFAIARAALDRICTGGWRMLAPGEELRQSEAAARETPNGK